MKRHDAAIFFNCIADTFPRIRCVVQRVSKDAADIPCFQKIQKLSADQAGKVNVMCRTVLVFSGKYRV